MKVKTPKEDPAAKTAREREQARADAAFIENSQELLDEETRRRVRRFGVRGRAARGGGAVAGSGGVAGGGGSFDPGGYGAGGNGSGSSIGGGSGGGAVSQVI